jgi:hypothetical protein
MRAIVLVFLMLAACRREQPPAPTTEQSAQLNEMDNALNQMGNEEGPEDRSPSPSNSTD